MSTVVIASPARPRSESEWFLAGEEPEAPSDAPRAVSTPAEAAAPAPIDVEWQRLWLATQRRRWNTLALIPIGEDISAPRIADALLAAGRMHLSGTIVAFDEAAVTLSTLQARISALHERVRCAERVILALPDVLRSPAALALAEASDAVILCIGLESSAVDEAERVADEVGRGRVIGSVIVRERKEKR